MLHGEFWVQHEPNLRTPPNQPQATRTGLTRRPLTHPHPASPAVAALHIQAVACPVNTVGTDLATNDCTPAPGFHGVTTATATAPYYATNTVNGADVQACTSQVGCDTDTADTCTTGANKALLQCTAMLAGYSSDGDGMVTGEWSGAG